MDRATRLVALTMMVGLLSATDCLGQAGASMDARGINARGLGLDGRGIGIGQVEVGRPGSPGLDNDANSHDDVNPAGVFVRAANAAANMNVDTHATQVAGVMVSKGATSPQGVASGAKLYSSATNVPTDPGQPEAAISAQHVATRNGGDVRAINFSFGEPLVPPATLNGNSLLTQFVDWSARVHETLYVIAGNEGAGGIPVPTDEFNGMTIGFTRQDGAGVYREVDPANLFTEDAVGARRSVDLVAPGRNVTMPIPSNNEGTAVASGTSFAAPHVTGTVALLQQYGDAQQAAAVPRFDGDNVRHEVMKAVLMNSADKVKDTGDGKLLGMEKTIVDTAGKNWLESDAATDDAIPLDDQLGVGQLNASRALKQFRPGEYDSFGTGTVGLIGWDYGVTLNDGDFNKYIFDDALMGDSYVSITLAWDRLVNLVDGNGNGRFDIGESFNAVGLTNLDLFLMPLGATNINQAIARSISAVDSVEHIFFKLPKTGKYEFWVRQNGATAGGGNQFYGVAWWAVPEPSTYLMVLAGLGWVMAWRIRSRRLALRISSAA